MGFTNDYEIPKYTFKSKNDPKIAAENEKRAKEERRKQFEDQKEEYERHLANRAKFGEFPELKNIRKDIVFYEKGSFGFKFIYYISVDKYTVFPGTGRSREKEKEYKLKAELFIFDFVNNELMEIVHLIDEEHLCDKHRNKTPQEKLDYFTNTTKCIPLDLKRASLFIKCIFSGVKVNHKIEKQYDIWDIWEKYNNIT
jgi:hypothetical protein